MSLFAGSGARVPLHLGGTVQVFCLHQQEKRSITTLEFDAAEFNPNICICCENMFLTPISDPIPVHCPECHPQNWEVIKNG